MSELITMTELTNTELDAVCGGVLDFGNAVTQLNSASNFNMNVLGVQAGDTHQTILQGNAALIGSAIFI
jgi:hypothetical protein